MSLPFFSPLKGPLVSLWGDHGAEAEKFTRQEKFPLPSSEFLDCGLLERRSRERKVVWMTQQVTQKEPKRPGHRHA